MRDMFDAIEKPVIITDDKQAIEAIVSLGVFDKVSKPFAPSTKATVHFHKITWHRKHWILVARYHGFKKAEDNGYMVMTWLKKDRDASAMDDHIASFANQPSLETVVDLSEIKDCNN